MFDRFKNWTWKQWTWAAFAGVSAVLGYLKFGELSGYLSGLLSFFIGVAP